MKDKLGVTRQTLSVHLLEDPHNVELDHNRIQVLWATRHRNKLRLGHLAGNRFSIRIRNVDPLKAPLAQRTLRRLESIGVPNYFGAQRFGYRRNNHIIGAALLKGDWHCLLAHLLGTTGGPFPPYQAHRRELFDAGRYSEAADQWTAADRSERIASTKLAQRKSEKEACLAVGGTALSFWISALQSAIFNRVLDQRLEEGDLARLEEGDVAWKHSTRGNFLVTAPDIAAGDLQGRLDSMEISPSGPLWGAGMMPTAGKAAACELEALEATGLSLEAFTKGRRSPEGTRRPLRVPLRNPSIDSGIDEYGEYIRCAFDLPRGSYATIVLREIMKSDHGDVEDHVGD